MSAVAFDTHAFVKRLTAAGMPEAQAEILAEEQVRLLDDRLATKQDLAALETRLNARIDAVAARLDGRIDALEARLDARIDALEARIDAVESRLDARIDQLAATLRSEMREVEARLRAEMHELAHRMTLRLSGGLAAAVAILAALQVLL